METDLVVKEMLVHAPVEKVWLALTDKEEMKNWYFTIAEFKAEPGFEFKMYGEKKGVKFPISCVIIEACPNKKLSYTWSYDDFPTETLVSFELTAMGSQTAIRLTHSGLEKLSQENRDISVQNHREGWDFIIGSSLKQYLELETA